MSENDSNTSATESKPAIRQQHMTMIDMIGTKWNRLTVISRDITPGYKKVRWHCSCECGNKRIVASGNLRDGNTQSCGCLRNELTQQIGRASKTHGQATDGNPSCEYAAWRSMKHRCCNAQSKFFKAYGGRGITVCSQWLHSFETFFADMGIRPAAHSLDRIDNDGNYEPSNCKWSTRVQQGRNQRTNRLLTYAGETLCLSEWAERMCIDKNTLYSRLARGWSVERALTEPVHHECDSSANRSV